MDAETKLALERFRSHEWWGEKLERDDEDTCLPREADAHRIVQLALSEHLPDDDEPVSEEWLADTGFLVEPYTMPMMRVGKITVAISRTGYVTLINEHGVEFGLMWVSTRGQVRRLIKELRGE